MNTSRDDLKIRLIAVKSSSSAGERKNVFFSVFWLPTSSRVFEWKQKTVDATVSIEAKNIEMEKKLCTLKYDINNIII